jgi:hypothetical protein
MKSNRLVGLALAAVFAAGPATAAVLYDNPADIGLDAGNCLFATGCAAVHQQGADIFAAQSFALGGAATVSGASFTELDASGVFAGPRSVNWAIYSDVSGMPGAMLAVGSSRFSRETLMGTDPDGLDIDAYGFATGDVPLAAGTYFLAFQEVSRLADNYLMVGMSDSGAAESVDGGAKWQSGYVGGRYDGLAVSVYGTDAAAGTNAEVRTDAALPVAEPASLGVFAAGLGALALRRRRPA